MSGALLHGYPEVKEAIPKLSICTSRLCLYFKDIKSQMQEQMRFYKVWRDIGATYIHDMVRRSTRRF